MDAKITFLNMDLKEEVQMAKPKSFCNENENHLICKFNKSIFGSCSIGLLDQKDKRPL